jgi:Lon protease-like protein
MNAFSPPHHDLAGFTGTAPLFPLPSAALLPHVSQPLHIFEERYRAMTADVLAGDRLIAMAILRPGWEPHYERKDVPIYPHVCLGRIALDQRLPDGRFMLVLRGVGRARVVAEEANDLPYRVARLELLADHYPHQPAIDRDHRRRELRELFCRLHPTFAETPALASLLEGELSLGALCDVLAWSLRLDAAAAIAMLQELNVDARSDLVLTQLKSRLRTERDQTGLSMFPPPFSAN